MIRSRGARSSGPAREFSASDIRIHFEGVKAVDGVDLSVRLGEILGLIGPNGAGKTTLLNGLSGQERLTTGSVRLGQIDVTGWSPQRLAHVGIARTFQNVRLFSRLTVFENVEAAALGMGGGRPAARGRAVTTLAEMGLESIYDVPAVALPAGRARQVGIARALACSPAFLLLDEPAAGLNDDESEELVSLIVRVREARQCGIVLIEHDMRVIMGLCDRIHVLNYGKTIRVGTPTEVREDEAVLTAYLGQRK